MPEPPDEVRERAPGAPRSPALRDGRTCTRPGPTAVPRRDARRACSDRTRRPRWDDGPAPEGGALHAGTGRGPRRGTAATAAGGVDVDRCLRPVDQPADGAVPGTPT